MVETSEPAQRILSSKKWCKNWCSTAKPGSPWFSSLVLALLLFFVPSLKVFSFKISFKMAVVSFLSLSYIHSLQKISYSFCPRSVGSVWRYSEAVAAGGVESTGESPLLVALT